MTAVLYAVTKHATREGQEPRFASTMLRQYTMMGGGANGCNRLQAGQGAGQAVT